MLRKIKVESSDKLEIIFMRTEKSDQLKYQAEFEIEGAQCSIEWLNDKTFCMEDIDGANKVPESLHPECPQ